MGTRNAIVQPKQHSVHAMIKNKNKSSAKNDMNSIKCTDKEIIKILEAYLKINEPINNARFLIKQKQKEAQLNN